MFLEVTAEDLNQSNLAHAVNYVALVTVLVEKGILTDAEVAQARVKATHLVEQEWARRREESEKSP